MNFPLSTFAPENLVPRGIFESTRPASARSFSTPTLDLGIPHLTGYPPSFRFPHTTLHYTTLHHTTPHHTTLHYTTLHYTTLHYTTLHYTTLHYTTPHYTTLHYTTLHHTTLHYTTLHHTTLHYTTPHGITSVHTANRYRVTVTSLSGHAIAYR